MRESAGETSAQRASWAVIGGRARYWVRPLAVATLGIVASALLLQGLRAQEEEALGERMQAQAGAIRRELEARLEMRLLALERMGRRAVRGGMERHDTRKAEARDYLEQQPGYDAIAMAESGVLRWTVGAVDAIAPEWIPWNLLASERPFLLQPDDSRSSYLAVAPVHEGKRDAGAIVAALDPHALIEASFPAALMEQYEVIVEDEGDHLFRSLGGEHDRELTATAPLRVGNLEWKVRLAPIPAVTAAERSALPFVVFLLGATLSLLLAGTVAVLGTARRRARQLQSANLRLRREMRERARVQRDLESLVYIASHDLKEPLRSIENFSNIVRDRYADRLDDKGRDFLERVARAAHRLDRLLEDLLTLSQAQRIGDQEEHTDLASAVQQAAARVEGPAAEAGVHIRVEGDWPRVRANPTWMIQAIYNLLVNAVKFSRGSKEPVVQVCSYHPPNGGAGVVVRDRGPGVPEAHRERIFHMFQRAVGRNVDGTGAGLAIVRQVAERHGGRAWMEPREGGGSAFYLTVREGEPDEE